MHKAFEQFQLPGSQVKSVVVKRQKYIKKEAEVQQSYYFNDVKKQKK